MRFAFAVALATSLWSTSADAHGIWGHVHVTGWAVENMPDDELRQFLLEPEVFNALLFGAVFTDTGYARDEPASRAYSEHTHWEPFIEDYVEWIRVNDPPPWTSIESKKRVAFLLGCASHGLQDSIFDSLFLHQVEERDGAGQSETDPGTDGFLVLDEHIRFIPERDIPMSTVLELYEGLSEDVTEEVIDASVGLTVAAYVNDEIGLGIAANYGERYATEMPWGREHYMDPAVPGSLRAEIYPTMRYQQALWSRLHGEFSADDVAVFAFPETPRRLRSGDASTTDSWVTLIFGEGVRYEGDLVELVDSDGTSVPFRQANTRWGAGHTRLIRVQPEQNLVPGGWYTARMRAGAELVGGEETTEIYELGFQVACDNAEDTACPDLGEIPVARIDGIPVEPEPEVEESGCGCQSSPARGMGWALLVGLLASRRRGE
ncbi:MAG: zinc dependent phospholipase C family protein [Proteobacteria bacterium]|nr:zinc dependent phospholipase C family protein [Pseudomonadota bacterium]